MKSIAGVERTGSDADATFGEESPAEYTNVAANRSVDRSTLSQPPCSRAVSLTNEQIHALLRLDGGMEEAAANIDIDTVSSVDTHPRNTCSVDTHGENSMLVDTRSDSEGSKSQSDPKSNDWKSIEDCEKGMMVQNTNYSEGEDRNVTFSAADTYAQTLPERQANDTLQSTQPDTPNSKGRQQQRLSNYNSNDAVSAAPPPVLQRAGRDQPTFAAAAAAAAAGGMVLVRSNSNDTLTTDNSSEYETTTVITDQSNNHAPINEHGFPHTTIQTTTTTIVEATLVTTHSKRTTLPSSSSITTTTIIDPIHCSIETPGSARILRRRRIVAVVGGVVVAIIVVVSSWYHCFPRFATTSGYGHDHNH